MILFVFLICVVCVAIVVWDFLWGYPLFRLPELTEIKPEKGKRLRRLEYVKNELTYFVSDLKGIWESHWSSNFARLLGASLVTFIILLPAFVAGFAMSVSGIYALQDRLRNTGNLKKRRA